MALRVHSEIRLPNGATVGFSGEVKRSSLETVLRTVAALLHIPANVTARSGHRDRLAQGITFIGRVGAQ